MSSFATRFLTRSSKPTRSTRQRALPLDEYIDLGEDSSDDEEVEETVTEPAVRCLWEGCRAKLEGGVEYDIWKEHIKPVHVNAQVGGNGNPPGKFRCKWDGCDRCLKQFPQGVARHILSHLTQLKKLGLDKERASGLKGRGS